MKKYKSTIYGIYDISDNHVLLHIGTARQVAKAIGCTPRRVRQCALYGAVLCKKYRVEKVGKDDEY